MEPLESPFRESTNNSFRGCLQRSFREFPAFVYKVPRPYKEPLNITFRGFHSGRLGSLLNAPLQTRQFRKIPQRISTGPIISLFRVSP